MVSRYLNTKGYYGMYSQTSIIQTPMTPLLCLIRIVFESLGNSSDSSRKQILEFSYFVIKLNVECIH